MLIASEVGDTDEQLKMYHIKRKLHFIVIMLYPYTRSHTFFSLLTSLVFVVIYFSHSQLSFQARDMMGTLWCWLLGIFQKINFVEFKVEKQFTRGKNDSKFQKYQRNIFSHDSSSHPKATVSKASVAFHTLLLRKSNHKN